MNLIITGESGSGKTTAVLRLMKYLPQPVYGIWTKKLPAPPDEDAPVYLHSFREPIVCEPQNRIGVCRARHATGYPEVFDTLGVRILRDIPENSVVILDEIGTMESAALLFQRELLRLLDGEYFVIATVRDKHTPLLDALRSHPKSVCVRAQDANDEQYTRQLAAQLLR